MDESVWLISQRTMTSAGSQPLVPVSGGVAVILRLDCLPPPRGVAGARGPAGAVCPARGPCGVALHSILVVHCTLTVLVTAKAKTEGERRIRGR